jgi:cytochrome P450
MVPTRQGVDLKRRGRLSTASPAEFRPYEPAFAADPYPVYAGLRERNPILFSEELGMTLFARYEDIRALLIDKRLGRTMHHVASSTERQRAADRWAHLPNYNRYVRVNLLEMEGSDHTRLRRLVSAALDPRRIRKLRDRIQALVNELLERIAPLGHMEFLEDLAVPLPVHMISELLGWPAELRDRLRPWSAQIVRLYEKDYTKEDEVRAESAATEFAAALNELADERGRAPRDDLVSALVAIRDHGQRLSRDELISTCMLLLNAGHEATVNGAGNGLLALMRRPHQLARLRGEPALIGTAIEELLRFDSPLQLFHRYVLEDFEHGGVNFARGDMVGFLYGSANRDPQAFERPDELDLTRKPNSHFAFGAGTHFCLGAPLARLELDVLFTTLLRRLPNIRLYGRPPEFRRGLVFRGLRELRVCW